MLRVASFELRAAAVMLLLVVCGGTVNAQLFPNARWNQPKQVGSSGGCPGGVCPTAAAPMAIQNTTAGHWSFPGTIDNHLELTHGVSTAGMSRQQKLNLHDQLHEGTSTQFIVPRQRVVTSIPRPSQSAVVQPFYPAQSQTYAPLRASGGCCGGSSGGFAVGSRDSLGDVITSVGPVLESSPSVAPALPEATAMESRKSRRASREVILESVAKAEAEGTLPTEQARAIRRASLRPRMLAQMESLIVEKAQVDGYALPMGSDGEVQMGAIPWNDLADFIVKIAPLIFKLIDLFSMGGSGLQAEKLVELNQLPQAYPDEWYQAA